MGRGQEILYHKDVYFPAFDFKRFWSNIFGLRASTHFRERQYTKGIPFPSLVKLKKSTIFEVGVVDGYISKVACRVQDQWYDYCYVISNSGCIITAWVQNPNDKHATLDKSRYATR